MDTDVEMKRKRIRHQRFFQPPEKDEGAYLAVMSPIDDSGILPFHLPQPDSLEEKWLSTEYRLKCAEAAAQNIYWGQDAIQSEFVNLGPGVHAAMVGGSYKLEPESIWFDTVPILIDWDNPPGFATDKSHILYETVENHTRALCTASAGRYAVSVTDIGGQLDVLYSLRGEDLLIDLIDYPDEVIAAKARLDRELVDYFNTLTDIIRPTGCGYTTWLPLVNSIPYFVIQCDVSVMISPAMFERFAMPSLDLVSAEIGCAIYHMDGPEQIPLLDMLLSLKHVHAIQWVPLPKNPGTGPYQDFADEMSLGIYKRCFKAGKKVVLYNVPPSQIGDIFDAVGCDGIYILTRCQSRKEADELITYAKKEWITL